MLGRKNRRASLAKPLKYFFIISFACSLAFIFWYGNFLMINRPKVENVSKGLVYPFFGKGGAIFVSRFDLGLMITSSALLLVSIITANRLAKTEASK